MNLRYEGHAARCGWHEQQLAQLDADDTQPPYAIADAWQPPHRLALPQALVDRLRMAAAASQPITTGTGDYFLPELDDTTRADVVARFAEANAAWWGLEVTEWDVMVKRYRAGQRHVAHQDTHPGAADRKVAGIAQLSHPDEYAGGDLVLHFARMRLPMPREAGTLVAMPGWTVHEVEPIEHGERWSLIVNGRGPRLR